MFGLNKEAALEIVYLYPLFTTFGEMGIKFGFFKKAEAYYTQLEMVAPGYVISPEEGGIVFDLNSFKYSPYI